MQEVLKFASFLPCEPLAGWHRHIFPFASSPSNPTRMETPPPGNERRTGANLYQRLTHSKSNSQILFCLELKLLRHSLPLEANQAVVRLHVLLLDVPLLCDGVILFVLFWLWSSREDKNWISSRIYLYRKKIGKKTTPTPRCFKSLPTF